MHRKLKRYLFVGVLLLALGTGSGCSDYLKKYFENDAETIHIGLIGPMSGDNRSVGESFVRGVRLYLDEVNRSGGVHGKRIVLDIHDDQNKPALAYDEASRIAEQNQALAVIGHHYSSCSIRAGEIYKKYGIPAITPASTNVDVTRENDWYFRASFNDNMQGRFLANYAHKVFGGPTVSIVCEDDAYGKKLSEVFTQTYEGLGGKIKDIKWFRADDKYLGVKVDEIVNKLGGETDTGVIFLATHAGPGIRFLKKIREDDHLKLKTVIGPDAFASEAFRKGFDIYPKEKRSPGYYTDGTYVTTPLIFDTSNEMGQQFKENYRRRYGQVPGWHAAFAYDSMLVLVHALKNTEIRATSAAVGEDRRKIRNFLATMQSIDTAVEGATGYNYFDKQRDAQKPVLIGVYRKQNLVSALKQFQTTSNPAVRSYLESKLDKERVIYFGENFMYRINVVFTGIDIKKISEPDFKNLTCTLDFELWFRYLGDISLNKVEFLNEKEPMIWLDRAIDEIAKDGPPYYIFKTEEKEQEDGIRYRRYRGRGRFDMDFIPNRYSYGKHIAGISFRHPELDRNNLIYVEDVIGMGNTYNKKALLEKLNRDQVISPATNWKISDIWFFQDIKSEISKGNPEHLNVTGGKVDYSRFNAGIQIVPDKFILRNMIPGAWVGYLLVFSFILFLILPVLARTRKFSPFIRPIWVIQVPVMMLLLLAGEYFSINWLGRNNLIEPIILGFNSLWWILPAIHLNTGAKLFIWTPLEEQTDRTVPHVVQSGLGLIIYVLAIFGIIAFVFDQKLTSLLASTGVAAMIFGLAVQVNISNIFSGIAINLERPFRVGDWVRIDAFKEGQVIDINWRATRIKTRDDTILCIPNSQASESAVENFSYPDDGYFKYFTVHVDPAHPPERVKKILLDAALSTVGVDKDPPPSTRFLGQTEGITGSSKSWVANYLISIHVRDYGQKFAHNEAVWSSVWTHLKRAGIRPIMQRQEMHMVLEGIRRRKAVSNKALTLLDELDIFKAFPDDAKGYLSQRMARHHFYPGESIVRQGESGNSLFIIEEGVVGVHVKFDNRTKAVEVARTGAGNFFGEMALLTGEKRTATIISVTETYLYEITKEDIAPLLEQEPKISKRLSDILTERKIATESRKYDNDARPIDKETLASQIFNKIQNFFGFKRV